jgi:hypothetical protein
VEGKGMSSISGLVRARILGLGEQTHLQAQQAIRTYVREAAEKDERRFARLIEAAIHAAADGIGKEEERLVRHSFFDQEGEALVAQARIERLTEDFHFLWSLQTLLRGQSFQRFAEDIASCLK